MQRQRPADAVRDGLGFGSADHHQFRTAMPAQYPGGLQFANRFTDSGTIDTKLSCQLLFRRQSNPRTQGPIRDPGEQRHRDLAVCGFEPQRFKFVHAVFAYSSRPISMRRISWVPAPIS